MASNDLPINSNVMIFSGNVLESLDIWDVYRPEPTADIRQIASEITMFSLVRFWQNFKVGNLESSARVGISDSGQVDAEERFDWNKVHHHHQTYSAFRQCLAS